MNNTFKKDFFRMTGTEYGKTKLKFTKIVTHSNLLYMYLYRKYEDKSRFIYKLLLHRMTKKYGLEISTKATLGEGVYLGHPYNITIAEGVKIGKNANLHKGCTIGRENRGKRIGTPVIGNNVFIGINSTVVGNCCIGNDVMIAPNTLVNFDVPDHSIVIGNPGTIHYRENATEDYVNFLV